VAPSIVLKDWEGDIPFADDFKEMLDDGEKSTSSTLVNKAVKSKLLPSTMHGTFLSAFRGLPTSVQVRNWQNMYSNRLTNAHDNNHRNWISEMIQNAKDVNATTIDIKLTNSSLVFGHDGDEFRPDELAALLNISMTTKSGDITTIGKFGIGFKYWHKHFRRISVVSWFGGVRHTLTMTRLFNSDESKYEFCNDTQYDSRTEFIFEDPEDKSDWIDFRNSGVDDILGARVEDSLPFIQSGNNSLAISIEDNGVQLSYGCKILDDLSINNIDIHRVEYGQQNNPNIGLKARVNLAYFENLEPNESERLKNTVIEKYKKDETVAIIANKDGKNIDDVAKEKADSAFDNTFISLLLTPENPKGGISSLFIATDVNIDCAFVADAPWQLDDTRLGLSMHGEDRVWNISVAKLVDRLYSRLMQTCLSDNSNFNLNNSEMFELLNRPLGSGNNQNTSASFIFRASNIDDHLEETFGLTGYKYHCSEALIWLWKKLLENNHEDARDWLEEAMHEDIATVKLANGTNCPVRHDHKTPYEIYDDKTKHRIFPEICKSLGNGIPPEISHHVDLIRANTPPDAPKLKTLLALFDDIVTDVNNNFSFLKEVEPSLISELPDWGTPEGMLIKEILENLNTALSSAQAHFLAPSKNLNGHVQKYADPLLFGELIQNLARLGYEASANPANLPALDAFLDCLITNRPSDLSWGRAVLASTTNEGERPLLVLLPPQNHAVAVAMGGKKHSHTLSIHIPQLLSNHVKIDFESPPEILHWGRGIDPKTVYIRTAEIPQVGPNRKPVGGTWEWSDFTLDYTAITGWLWPLVTFEHLDEQHRLDVLNRSTPVFIDALHPHPTSDHGVHKGLRTRDSKDNITVEEKPLHPYKVRDTRSVDCMSDDKGVPMQIMKAAVSLNSKSVRNYRTNAISARPKPLFEGSIPHIHGVFRVLGVLSKLVDDESVIGASDPERLRKLYLYSWWVNKLREYSTDNSSKISREHLAFDVIWVQGKEHTKLGLCAKYIPWPGGNPSLTQKTYLGDNDDPRNRESQEFDDLRQHGLVGFQDRIFNQPYKNQRQLFPGGHLWLPRLEQRRPDDVPQNYFDKWLDIDPLRLSSDDEIKEILTATAQIDSKHKMRPGLDRLLEIIFGNDPKNTEEGLSWLEELLVNGLPKQTWLDASLQSGKKTNRTRLKKLLDKLSRQADYPRIWEVVQTVNTQATWDTFFEISLTGGNAEKILDQAADARIPMLVKNGDLWSTDKEIGPTIRSLAEENIGDVHVIVSKREDFPRSLFDIEKNVDIHIVPERQMLNALERVCEANKHNQIVEVLPYRTLEGEVKTNGNPIPSTQINPKIRYINEMLSGLVEMGKLQAEISWYPHDCRGAGNNSHPMIPAKHCPVLDWEDGTKDSRVIHISDIRANSQPNFVEHEIIAEWLISYLDNRGITATDVAEVVNHYDITCPWWFTIPIGNVNQADKTVEFNRQYCWGQLRIEELMKILTDIKDDSALDDAVDDLVRVYTNNDPSIQNSNVLLAELYESIPSIIPDWMGGSFNPQRPVAVRNHIDIASHMLSKVTRQRIPRDHLNSIGACLRVNPSEHSAFSGHAENFDPDEKPAYDFSEEVRDLLWDAIWDQWFSTRDDFIMVEDMFIRNDGSYDDGKLHKLHALHILAFLYAKLGV